MKLYIATFALLAFSAVVTPRSVPVSSASDESLGDDIKNFFDTHITFNFVEALTPVISKQVHETFQRTTRETIGGSFEQVMDQQWSALVSSKWPGEGWPFVDEHVIKPLKSKALEFRSRWQDDALKMYDDIAKIGEDLATKGIKKGVDDYFAVGDAHKSFPSAINVTHTGVEGWVQGKLESLHATIMYESKPLLKNYDLKSIVLNFAEVTVQKLVKEIVGDDIDATALGHKAVLWVASTFKAMCALVADRALEKATKDGLVIYNRSMRQELYRPFGFLSEDVAKINANVN